MLQLIRTCTCTYMYVHVQQYITYTAIIIYTCTCTVYTTLYMYVYMYTVYTYMYMYITSTQLRVYVYIYMYIHVYIHVHVHVQHIQMKAVNTQLLQCTYTYMYIHVYIMCNQSETPDTLTQILAQRQPAHWPRGVEVEMGRQTAHKTVYLETCLLPQLRPVAAGDRGHTAPTAGDQDWHWGGGGEIGKRKWALERIDTHTHTHTQLPYSGLFLRSAYFANFEIADSRN